MRELCVLVTEPIFPEDFPKVICLCGSTKFRAEYEKTMAEETLKGQLVWSVGLFGHEIALDPDSPTKAMLDRLHLKKIMASDEVVVVSRGGYTGSSTRGEIIFARSRNIPVRFIEDEAEANFFAWHAQTDRERYPWEEPVSLRVI